jgi:DHA1 family bicyclomycin/chloramphenicol resistance-like MFS transporter
LSEQSLLRRAVVLGLLIAVGAFAVDMYIPGFAAISRDLHTGPGVVQLSMTSYFLSLAIGQLFYGPLSDAFGRKPPIYFGLAIFAVGCAAAAAAPTIDMLIAARFLQGLGAAATAVIPMAVIRDQHTGPDAARLMSLAMLALSVSPILAPEFGGVLVQFTSWRLLFGVLILITGLAAIMTARMLPETLPFSRRIGSGPAQILVTYIEIARNRYFILPIMIAGCAQSVLFVFISGSPFVFVTLHRLSPILYGGLFALHAIALIGISQFNAPMLRYFGMRPLVGGASLMVSVASITLAVLVAAGMTSLLPFVLLTLLIFTGLGLMMAPAFLAAMEPFGENAGSAAALGVALELSASSGTTFLLGITADGTARPLTILMALAACGSFVGWALFMRTPAPVGTIEAIGR